MEVGDEHPTLRRLSRIAVRAEATKFRWLGSAERPVGSEPGSSGAPGSEPGTASTGKVKRRSQSGIDAEKAAPDAPGNGACEKRTRGRVQMGAEASVVEPRSRRRSRAGAQPKTTVAARTSHVTLAVGRRAQGPT